MQITPTSSPTHAQQIPQAFSTNEKQLTVGTLLSVPVWCTYKLLLLFLIMPISLNPDQWMLRTQCLAGKYFLYIRYTMNSLKLQTPTVSNVNSNCLYSELLRFPSIIGPWEDWILPLPAGERIIHIEEKESKNDKSKERQQRRNCTKKLKFLPSGERLSGVFTRFLSDEPLEDKSETLSTMAGCGRDTLSQPCMTGK